MSGERTLHPEYRDELQSIRYPFVDTVSLRSTTGRLLPADLFLDAVLYPTEGGGSMALTTLTAKVQQISVTIGDRQRPVIARGVFDPVQPAATIPLTDIAGRAAGTLVLNQSRAVEFQAWPLITHTFAPGTADFVTSCAIPSPERGVRGLTVDGTEILSGDVWIVGEHGVVVREEAGNVRIDIVGDPLFVRTLCRPTDLFNPPVYLQTINGLRPDAHGRFPLAVVDIRTRDTILRMTPVDSSTLRVEAVGQRIDRNTAIPE